MLAPLPPVMSPTIVALAVPCKHTAPPLEGLVTLNPPSTLAVSVTPSARSKYPPAAMPVPVALLTCAHVALAATVTT